MKPSKPTERRVSYNDLDLSRWKEYVEDEEEPIWTDSLWHIPSRARGNGHALEYHGNFVPQIATQIFRRFSKKDEVVLDLFLGSGTSAVEAVRRERRCVGVELKPELAEQVRAKLAGEERVEVLCGDSASAETETAVREALARWGREHADLLVLHPPYGDIIRFSERPECLSNASSPEEFLKLFQRVAERGFRLLRPGRFAVLVIGDRYEAGALVPLGFECMRAMNEVGFRTRSIVVKNIEGNEIGKGKAGNLWRYRALAGGFYIFKHEYVMIFDKPLRQRSRSGIAQEQGAPGSPEVGG